MIFFENETVNNSYNCDDNDCENCDTVECGVVCDNDNNDSTDRA